MLSEEDATIYGAIVARANYLAVGRPYIMYAAQERCSVMATPTQVHCTNRKGMRYKSRDIRIQTGQGAVQPESPPAEAR